MNFRALYNISTNTCLSLITHVTNSWRPLPSDRYTLWVKKTGPLIFTVTLANVGRFLKFFQCQNQKEMAHNKNEKFPTVALTLLLHYLVKLTLVWKRVKLWSSVSRNTRLHFSRFVASKQSRSQSSWLRDLCCHAASYVPEENPHHRRTEAEADWSLVRPWTVNCQHGYWSVAQKT